MKARLLAVIPVLLVLAGCGGDEDAAPAADPSGPRTITVTSPAFAEGEGIPATYACTGAGAGAAPGIRWSGIGGDVGSLALVVDDPDAPGGDYVHWIVLGIPATADGIGAGDLPDGAKELEASGGPGWSPPCPPSGTHHYRFTVYAFRSDETFSIESHLSPAEVIAVLADQAVAWGRLTGTMTAD